MTCTRRRIIFRGSAVLASLAAFGYPAFAAQACSSTVRDAVAASLGQPSSVLSAAPFKTGYRVSRTLDDPALNRRWLWVSACSGRERPAQLISVPLEVTVARARFDRMTEVHTELVHAGDPVLVVGSDKALSIRLSGAALQSGDEGQRVQVRIRGWHEDKILEGRVSGKDEVRLINIVQDNPTSLLFSSKSAKQEPMP